MYNTQQRCLQILSFRTSVTTSRCKTWTDEKWQRKTVLRTSVSYPGVLSRVNHDRGKTRLVHFFVFLSLSLFFLSFSLLFSFSFSLLCSSSPLFILGCLLRLILRRRRQYSAVLDKQLMKQLPAPLDKA